MNRGVSSEFLEQVRNRNDIVDFASRYITLNRRGGSFWACCPFHNEKTPSFSIKQDGQFYKCFGCGESGNIFSLAMKLENIDFMTAVEMLAKNAGLEMPSNEENKELLRQKRERETMYKILNCTCEFYHNNLINNPQSAQTQYLKSRQMNDAMIKKFKIGASLNYDDLPKHLLKNGFKEEEIIKAGVVAKNEFNKLYDFYGGRLMFPIFNGFGDVVAFSGRSVDANPAHAKYKNTPQSPIFNKSEVLFAYNFARELKKQHMLDSLVIVEGHIDVIMCHQAGITNTIGCMGTALTSLHARKIKQLVDNVILCLDADGAGSAATYKAINTLKEVGLNVRVVRLVGAKDPDEYIKKFGKDKFMEFLENSIDCVDFVLQDSAKKYNLNSNIGKNNYVNEALNYISKFSTPAEQEIYLKAVQNLVKIPIDFLRKSMLEPTAKHQTEEETPTESVKNKSIIDAKILILSALLYKKINNFEDFVGIFNTGDELSELYGYLYKKIKNNEDFSVSAIFDEFEITSNSLLDRVINYSFPEDNLLTVMISDATKHLKLFNLEQQKAENTKLMMEAKTIEERYKYLNKIQELTMQINKEKK